MNAAERARAVLIEVLALHTSAELSFFLKAVALELGVRMHCDARNYVLRAAACLDDDVSRRNAVRATEERPPGA